MFSTAKNQFKKILNIPDLHEKIIIGSMGLGATIGTVYGVMNSTGYIDMPLDKTIINSLIGGIIGATSGFIAGATSPVLVPLCIFSGVIGSGIYGYNKTNW